MKKELNLELDAHMDLVQQAAFKSLEKIKESEIIELRHAFTMDENVYSSKIELKCIDSLGSLGLDFKITEEIERLTYYYIHFLIHELPVESLDSDDELTLSKN